MARTTPTRFDASPARIAAGLAEGRRQRSLVIHAMLHGLFGRSARPASEG